MRSFSTNAAARVLACACLLAWIPAAAAAQAVEVLHRFEVPPFAPLGGLVEAGDGFLYGTTSEGGEGGLMYRIPVAGGPLTIVHRFARGHVPATSMTRGQGGVLFGTTQAGIENEGGTVFRFDPATATLITLHTFQATPSGRVIQASDGLLYGTTTFELYQIDPVTGRTRTLYTFSVALPGPLLGTPRGGLTEAGDGFLYGVTNELLYKADRAGTTLTVIHRYFNNDPGWDPSGGLTLTSDGLLYGTTTHGGAQGAGTIFRYDPTTGSYASVRSFLPFTASDGIEPVSRLVEAADGSLYGTTRGGGPGYGTVYRLRRPDRQTHDLSTVAIFDVPATLGREPLADLARASDGWIYGATRIDGPSGGGTLFRVDSLERGGTADPAQFAVVHAFSNRGPGWRPAAEPVAGPGGFVYGMTNAGGADGFGDVYRLDTTTGVRTTVGPVPGVGFGGPPLFPEIGANDGRLVDGGDGSFYATSLLSRILRVTPSTNSVTTVMEFTQLTGSAGLEAGLVGGPAGIFGLRDSPQGLRLFRFDPSTASIAAEWSIPGDPATSAALTATGSGILVSVTSFAGTGVSAQRVIQVDPASGAVTLLTTNLNVPRAVAPQLGFDGSVYYAGGDPFTAPQLLARTSAGVIKIVCTFPGYGQITSINHSEDGGRVFVVKGFPGVDQALYECPVAQVPVLPLPARLAHAWGRPDGRVSPLRHISNQGYYGVTDELLPYFTGDLHVSRTYEGGGTVLRAFGSPFDPDGDGLTSTFETTYGLSDASATGDDGPSGDPDGDGVTNLEEQNAGTHPRGFVTRYLAEGAENRFFHTQIALANAGLTPATVLLRFQTDSGVIVPHIVTVLPTSRATVDAASVPELGSGSFSTAIESDVPITVDRTMSWDDTGYGSHREAAVAAPSTSWFFAEGTTTGDQSLFYLLQNPQSSAVTATVRYLRALGLPPIEKTYVLPAHSRTTIPVDIEDPGLVSTDVSAAVTATAPIIAERAMYRSRPGQPFAAGSASAGVTAPALEWFLAEGATGRFFDLFILIANPNPAPAAVEVQYLRADGTVLQPVLYAVPANGRFTIWVDDEQLPRGSNIRPLANGAVSAVVRGVNGLPIVVERTMWWPGPETTPDFWYESHNSPGATATSLRWGIAGAEVSGADAAQTYVLIANATASAGQVMVRVLFENGNTTGGVYAIPAQSRTNVSIASDFPETAWQRVSVVVESIGATPVPIAVESATYASPGGVVWARGTNALATPLP